MCEMYLISSPHDFSLLSAIVMKWLISAAVTEFDQCFCLGVKVTLLFCYSANKNMLHPLEIVCMGF